MALLRKLELFTFDDSAWLRPPHNGAMVATVGNNRTLERGHDTLSHKPALRFMLYGHPVASLASITASVGFLQISTCGHDTTTTRAAINDALRGFGIKGKVSFAGGKLSLRVADWKVNAAPSLAATDSYHTHTRESGGVIALKVRYGQPMHGKYIVTMRHDSGLVRITTWASSPLAAGKVVCAAEQAPESAIVTIAESR